MVHSDVSNGLGIHGLFPHREDGAEKPPVRPGEPSQLAQVRPFPGLAVTYPHLSVGLQGFVGKVIYLLLCCGIIILGSFDFREAVRP